MNIFEIRRIWNLLTSPRQKIQSLEILYEPFEFVLSRPPTKKKKERKKALDLQARISHFPQTSAFVEFLRLSKNVFHFSIRIRTKRLRLERMKGVRRLPLLFSSSSTISFFFFWVLHQIRSNLDMSSLKIFSMPGGSCFFSNLSQFGAKLSKKNGKF